MAELVNRKHVPPRAEQLDRAAKRNPASLPLFSLCLFYLRLWREGILPRKRCTPNLNFPEVLDIYKLKTTMGNVMPERGTHGTHHRNFRSLGQ